MRRAFIECFQKAARSNKKLFLLCGDLGYSVVEPFVQEFPDRFLNAGIAEQNMTGVAAGLAMEGYRVFTYSIGNFPTLRCLEQIRYDICYHNLDVKIVAVGAGFAYGALGPSHHATEDIAVMRVLPGMKVICPADPYETLVATNLLCNEPGPAYLRLNRTGDEQIHDCPPRSIATPIFVAGRGSTVVLACGAIVSECARIVRKSETQYRLYSVPLLAPLDATGVLNVLKDCDSVVTIEEHQLNGGFGSAIGELLHDAYATGLLERMPRLVRRGIRNTFTSVAGSQEYLRRINGIEL